MMQQFGSSQVLTKNGLTPEVEREILKDETDAKRSRKSYATAEEAHRAILGKNYLKK